MSHLTGLLRQIAKKSSHPNALVYKVQLERARVKYLVQGQIDDEKDGAVALGAPEELPGQKMKPDEENSTLEMKKGGNNAPDEMVQQGDTLKEGSDAKLREDDEGGLSGGKGGGQHGLPI